MAATTKPPTKPPSDILDAMTSPTWWGPWFSDGDWSAWRAFLAAAFGLPQPKGAADIMAACTGLQDAPEARAREVYAVIGRRGGKTKCLSLIAAYLAAFVDWRPYLSRGERAHILLVAKDRVQAGIAFQYVLSFFADHPRLKHLISDEPHQDQIELKNQVTIRVASASFRGLRGYAIAALLADELAYWFEGEAANPAEEILRAIRPAMLQFKGKAMLLAGSSPFKRSGPLWEAYRDYFGKPGSTLVW
jgi:phage terminase large subunit-like protein